MFSFNFLASLIYYYFYLINMDNIKSDSWIPHVSKDFYYHFLFANFFGSRIMGVFFFFIFITLVYKNYLITKVRDYNFAFFLILFFLSYLIPLFYNFIFQPILIPRYIVFVLIPIIILISSLTYKIQNIKLKR